MRILIPTLVHDIHATAVHVALAKQGHEVVRWFGEDFPIRQAISFKYLPEHCAVRGTVVGCDIHIENDLFDVIWLRRIGPPLLPETLCPADKKHAERENREFLSSIWYMFNQDAFWVNSYGGRFRSNSKMLQLREATRTGMVIPKTLISNDPNEIHDFIHMHDGHVIYKPFVPMDWQEKNNQLALYTSRIEKSDLPDPEVLQLTPGIFQTQIPKLYELRVTYFGDYSVAVKLNSQRNKNSHIDWRIVSPDKLAIEPWRLPAQVDHCCRKLMRRLGIVFGCFDFIVTPDNQHVFLEVNEMGQWLWIEEVNPEIMLLDVFCKFLLNCSRDFHWEPEHNSIHFKDVLALPEFNELEEQDKSIHLQGNS